MFSSESGRPSRSSITCVGSRERVAAVERIKDDVDAPLHHRPQTFDRARRHGLEKQRLEAIMIVVVAVEEPAVIVLDDVAEPRIASTEPAPYFTADFYISTDSLLRNYRSVDT